MRVLIDFWDLHRAPELMRSPAMERALALRSAHIAFMTHYDGLFKWDVIAIVPV